MEAQADEIGGAANSLASGSFAVNLLMAGSLSLLWGLINALQLLTHFPFFNVLFAENARTYHQALYDLAQL